jgi:hypothetical protein
MLKNEFLPTIWLVESKRIGIGKIDPDKFVRFLYKKLIVLYDAVEIQNSYEKRCDFIRECINHFV